jgi:putative tricarboxylic transport membrane protein
VTSFARRGDFWAGLALAALGAYIVSQAWGWTYMGEDGPGAGFFPMAYGSLMVLLSLALVAATVLRKPAKTPPAAPRWRDLGRALSCWLAFVASIALMPLLGFAVSFALLTWFIVAVMARKPQRIAIPLAVGGALGFVLLFEWALDLSLPKGLLF